MLSLYAALIRPALFLIPPEPAQRFAERVLAVRAIWRAIAPLYAVSDKRLETQIAGIRLTNPVGVAAGLDKDCRFLGSLLGLGFGYAVGGTVTLNPRPGNPKPRLMRYPKEKALVNAMGFPGKGARQAVKNLQKLKRRSKPIFVSIAGLVIEEFLECQALLDPWVDGIEVNISSPNTPGLRAFHEPAAFSELVGALAQRRKRPLFVKLPPYFDGPGRERVMSLVDICKRHEVDGLTAINTRPIEEPRLKVGMGGLSGKAIFPDMLRVVADIRKEVGPKMVLNACGGIFTAQDAFDALEAGANTVQLYTGMVYRGPGIAGEINRGLVRMLDERGIKSVAEVTGR